MMFWRNRKNKADQEQEAREDKILHHPREPEIEPATESDENVQAPDFIREDVKESAADILDENHVTPVPRHTLLGDAEEAEDLRDHSAEGGWFARLSRGLNRSSDRLGQGIAEIFTHKRPDAQTLEALEELLITADVGAKTAAQIAERVGKHKFAEHDGPQAVKRALADEIAAVLEPVAKPLVLDKPENGPFVILMCGVNGAGKTTTIGKLAHNWHMHEHRKVMIAACDTFRAAAIEQLEVWADRAHVPLVKKEIGADAAAVAYEAYEKAKAEGTEILLIDTAGRLQNKAHLMEELAKIVRVLQKQGAELPHARLLVLDATTGQNALSQVEVFKETVDLTGLIVTKLDGSAKGGVTLALADKFGLSIHAAGVGEQPEDLSPFKAEEFAAALVGLDR